MSTTLVEIEALLRRSEHRDVVQDLGAKIERLTPDEAEQLLERILSFAPGDREPTDVRRFHRAIRSHLLHKISDRLGPVKSERLRIRLAGSGRPADAKLQAGLLKMFPRGTEPRRDELLRALQAPPLPIPMISLEFHNDPADGLSSDDRCDPRWPIDRLGSDPNSGRNNMEIQGTVIGHRPGIEYAFDRTIERGRWHGRDGIWAPPKKGRDPDYLPPGTIDEWYTRPGRTDQDVQPRDWPYHIYSVDTPGLNFVPIAPDDTDCVFMMNAVEKAWVKIGKDAWLPMARLEWKTATWMEKVGGSWRRKPGMNLIKEGSIFGLDSPEPPTIID